MSSVLYVGEYTPLHIQEAKLVEMACCRCRGSFHRAQSIHHSLCLVFLFSEFFRLAGAGHMFLHRKGQFSLFSLRLILPSQGFLPISRGMWFVPKGVKRVRLNPGEMYFSLGLNLSKMTLKFLLLSLTRELLLSECFQKSSKQTLFQVYFDVFP